jgi:hypothetical protein
MKTITGPVTVDSASGYVFIGADDDDATACAGNTIGAKLTLTSNTGGVETAGNAISGPVRIGVNRGSGLLPEDAVPEFEGNRVDGPLECSGNEPSLRESGNDVSGPRTGQCS